MKNSLALFTGAAALVLGLTACGSDAKSETAATTQPTAETTAESPAETPAADGVGIKGSRFGPTELAVGVGDTVTFTNNDAFAHTVTSKDDSAISFDSGKIGEGETFDVDFTEAGTFNYFCQIHPTMRASIVVS